MIPYHRHHTVAPPRGERGLKQYLTAKVVCETEVAPPRGERGLKPHNPAHGGGAATVAPPRGERGLKPSFRCGKE